MAKKSRHSVFRPPLPPTSRQKAVSEAPRRRPSIDANGRVPPPLSSLVRPDRRGHPMAWGQARHSCPPKPCPPASIYRVQHDRVQKPTVLPPAAPAIKKPEHPLVVEFAGASEEYVRNLESEANKAVTSAYDLLVKEAHDTAKAKTPARPALDTGTPPSNQETATLDEPTTDAAYLDDLRRRQGAFSTRPGEQAMTEEVSSFGKFLDAEEKKLEKLQQEWLAVSAELRQAVEELIKDHPPAVDEGELGFAAQMIALREEVEHLGETQMDTLQKSERDVKRKWKAMQDMFVQTFVDDMEEDD